MTILFDASAPVKLNPSFGLGILPPARTPRRDEPTAEDRAWWAEQQAARERAEYNAHLEWMAFESAALDHYERGVITDLDVLVATGAVG